MRMTTLAHVSGTGELLEGSTPAAGPPGYLSNKHGLSSAPIQSDWIIEGKPLARNRRLAGSTDGLGATLMWDCTAGRFHWYYTADETVYLVEGSITVVDSAGQVSQLWAGDTFFFPQGTRFEWTVHTYVRKIAFIHVPVSGKLALFARVGRAVMRRLRGAK